MSEAVVLVVFAASVGAYFAPTIIAQHRKVTQQSVIVLINLLLGWTVLGWLAALIMAFRDAPAGARRQVQAPPPYQGPVGLTGKPRGLPPTGR